MLDDLWDEFFQVGAAVHWASGAKVAPNVSVLTVSGWDFDRAYFIHCETLLADFYAILI